MRANELRKGDRVVMRDTGWLATIADNRKGNIRLATVEGIYTELGSIYAHDIEAKIEPDGTRTPVEVSAKQAKLKAQITALGL